MKLYTAFISSVYTELIDERDCVIKTMLDMDVFPICMEHFAVTDTGRFEDIKRKIDDSDFVVLILGKELGSKDLDGKSWTQKEYEYAKEKEIPTLALKTNDWCDLEKKKKRGEALTESEETQLQFGKDILAERTEDYSKIERVVSTFLHDRISDRDANAGWVRGKSSARTKKENEIWKSDNAFLRLPESLYHFHMIPNDKTYLRIGTINIEQTFDKEHFSQVRFVGNNFAAVYDRENDRLKGIYSKSTEWSGKYVLSPKGRIEAGVYSARKYDTDKYGKMQVTPGVRRGFHDFEIIDELDVYMRGAFHDEVSDDQKTGGKAGKIFVFTTEEERLRYLKKEFPEILASIEKK